MDLSKNRLFAAVLALTVGIGPTAAYAADAGTEEPKKEEQADTQEDSSGGDTSSTSGNPEAGSGLDFAALTRGLGDEPPNQAPSAPPLDGFQYADNNLAGSIDPATGRFDFKGGEGGMIRPEIAERLANGAKLVMQDGQIMGVTGRDPRTGEDISYPLERYELAGLQQLMNETPKSGDAIPVGTLVAPGLAVNADGQGLLVNPNGTQALQGPLSPQQQAVIDGFMANRQAAQNEKDMIAANGAAGGFNAANLAMNGSPALTDRSLNNNGLNDRFPGMPAGWHPPMAVPESVSGSDLSDQAFAALTDDDSMTFGANGFNGSNTPPGGDLLASNPAGSAPAGGTPAGTGRAVGIAGMTDAQKTAAKESAIAYQRGLEEGALNQISFDPEKGMGNVTRALAFVTNALSGIFGSDSGSGNSRAIGQLISIDQDSRGLAATANRLPEGGELPDGMGENRGFHGTLGNLDTLPNNGVGTDHFKTVCQANGDAACQS